MHGLLVICSPVDKGDVAIACPCSCFRPDVRVATSGRNDALPWVAAGEIDTDDFLFGLAADADLPDLTLDQKRVIYTTHGPESNDLYILHPAGPYRPLALTEYHAILLADGSVTTAGRVRVGDEVINGQGAAVAISHISRESAVSDVVNFLIQGDKLSDHLLVAEGIVVGDLLWQNSLDADIARVSLRK